MLKKYEGVHMLKNFLRFLKSRTGFMFQPLFCCCCSVLTLENEQFGKRGFSFHRTNLVK